MPYSDLLILDFEQRKLHLKKLGQKLDGMRSKHHLLILEQVGSLASCRRKQQHSNDNVCAASIAEGGVGGLLKR